MLVSRTPAAGRRSARWTSSRTGRRPGRRRTRRSRRSARPTRGSGRRCQPDTAISSNRPSWLADLSPEGDESCRCRDPLDDQRRRGGRLGGYCVCLADQRLRLRRVGIRRSRIRCTAARPASTRVADLLVQDHADGMVDRAVHPRPAGSEQHGRVPDGPRRQRLGHTATPATSARPAAVGPAGATRRRSPGGRPPGLPPSGRTVPGPSRRRSSAGRSPAPPPASRPGRPSRPSRRPARSTDRPGRRGRRPCRHSRLSATSSAFPTARPSG